MNLRVCLSHGHLQVPEGFYALPLLNPDSRYHLSIRVDYPNADDVRHSKVPRDEMGGDIYIHGSNASIGCLAMGDPAIEELFCLAAQVEPDDREIILAPVDFRRRPDFTLPEEEPRVEVLYERIRLRLAGFPPPREAPSGRGG